MITYSIVYKISDISPMFHDTVRCGLLRQTKRRENNVKYYTYWTLFKQTNAKKRKVILLLRMLATFGKHLKGSIVESQYNVAFIKERVFPNHSPCVVSAGVQCISPKFSVCQLIHSPNYVKERTNNEASFEFIF